MKNKITELAWSKQDYENYGRDYIRTQWALVNAKTPPMFRHYKPSLFDVGLTWLGHAALCIVVIASLVLAYGLVLGLIGMATL